MNYSDFQLHKVPPSLRPVNGTSSVGEKMAATLPRCLRTCRVLIGSCLTTELPAYTLMVVAFTFFHRLFDVVIRISACHWLACYKGGTLQIRLIGLCLNGVCQRFCERLQAQTQTLGTGLLRPSSIHYHNLLHHRSFSRQFGVGAPKEYFCNSRFRLCLAFL